MVLKRSSMANPDQLLHNARYGHLLKLYNPFRFLPASGEAAALSELVALPLAASHNLKVFTLSPRGTDHHFLVKHLDWDSRYFGFDCFQIEMVLYDHTDHRLLHEAVELFVRLLPPGSYTSFTVPATDIVMMQALSGSPFLLVEPRVNYALDLRGLTPDHFDVDGQVGLAAIDDANALGGIASRCRNPFDRVHADPAFSTDVADAYLGVFASESVKGFADAVFKISDKKGIPYGFLAVNQPVVRLGYRVSKLVLAAADASVARGSLSALLKAVTAWCIHQQADYLTTITQAANGAAIRAWEKGGFSLYSVTQVYSLKR